MKISIVIQYYNRRQLLLNTLNSILETKVPLERLEVIIVDDASSKEHSIADIKQLYPELNILIHSFKVEEKWWACPVIPINKGISMATGDVIVFLCAECLFVGDVLQDLSERIKPGEYVVYGTYAIREEDTDSLPSLESSDISWERFEGHWYHHSKHNPTYYNFCSAMLREDLLELGGFDERYAHGIAHGDNDFLLRVQRKGMVLTSVESVYTIHQWHPPMLEKMYPTTGQIADGALYNHVVHNEPGNYRVKNSFVSPMTFCISTWNNLPYLKLAIESVRRNSFFKDAPFIVHAENCTDGTNEWLRENAFVYNLDYYLEENEIPLGIGGGMNFCADKVKTEYIMFLHSDFYVTKFWDIELLRIHEQHPTEKLWVNSYRIEPNIFNTQPRHGTTHTSLEDFGAYYHDFNAELFEQWAEEFKTLNAEYQVPKGEGVSGLVKRSVWNEVGGNDPLFAPASWDDMDLFLRMLQHNVRFVLPATSVVWHFGARGSHRLEENDGKSSQRQQQAEQRNVQKWLEKWGRMPIFNEYGMIQQWKD